MGPRFLRPSEWLLVLYFAYTAVLAAFSPLSRGSLLLWVDLGLLVALALLAWAGASQERRTLSIIRDWLPVPLLLCAYWEMSWFQLSGRTPGFERSWIALDKVLLNQWGLKATIDRLGVCIPSLLELSYSLMYALLPVSIGILYLCRRRRRVDRFLFIFLLGSLLAYSLFPFLPSEPPRRIFPGEDLPATMTIFRRFNLGLLDRYDILTSVCPSGHVAGSYAAAFGMLRVLPEKKWIGVTLLGMAVIIQIATLYGRYHYAVDGFAGLVVSLAALGITHLLEYGRRRFTIAD